jgi:hypothetical protein
LNQQFGGAWNPVFKHTNENHLYQCGLGSPALPMLDCSLFSKVSFFLGQRNQNHGVARKIFIDGKYTE